MVGQSPKAFPLPCSARTQKTMEGEFGADHCIVEVGVIKRFYLVICRFVAVPASLLYLTTSLFTFGGPESSLAGARLLSSSHSSRDHARPRWKGPLMAMKVYLFYLLATNIARLAAVPTIIDAQPKHDRGQVAAICRRMAALIFIDVQQSIFYLVDDLDPNCILVCKPKQFKCIDKLNDTLVVFVTGF